jgi:trimeric autotransporter adhesin
VDGAGSGTKYGISSSVVGLAGDSSPLYGYQVAMTPNGTGSTYGLFSSTSGVGTGTRYGLYNSINMLSTNTSAGIGIYNYINKPSLSTGILYGYQSTVYNDGNGASYGIYVNNGGFTTSQRFGVYMTGETDNYFSGNVGIGLTGPVYQLQLSTNSAAKPTSNVWTIPSDLRLKKDVRDYEEGLTELLKIRPVWYTYTGEAGMPKETGVGIIAQELQQIAPHMVKEWTYKPSHQSTGRNSSPSDPENQSSAGESKNYLAVDNGAMTYMIINAIKEQQKIIEDLKKLVEEQGKIISELQKK